MHRVAYDRLPNGLRVVAIQRPHLHRSVVSAYVEAGSRHESPRTNGLSHFLEHMLFRGTESHPTAYALNDAIERLGGSLGAATHGDYTVFDLTVPPEALAAGCAVLGTMLTRPVFSQIEVEKGIVREEILEDLDDDHRDVNADNRVRRMVFGAHPLGYPITGTLENVERFTQVDLRRHMDRHYRAGSMVVSVCSPLPASRVVKMVARGFRALPSGQGPAARRAKIRQRRGRIQQLSSVGSQTCVRVAFPSPGEETSMAPAIELLMRVLDDGMSARLHRRICDELGLAYEVSAGVELFRDVGVADVAATVGHGSVSRLVSEVLVTLGDLAVDGPSRDELEKVKQRYAFDLCALDDDAQGLADHYGAAALWNERADLEQRRAQVLALAPADVRRAAQVLFTPMRLNIAVIGTVSDSARDELSLAVRRFRERVGRLTWRIATRGIRPEKARRTPAPARGIQPAFAPSSLAYTLGV